MLLIERFSIECRKTKTKVITLGHVADAKCRKTRTSESQLGLVLLLIG